MLYCLRIICSKKCCCFFVNEQREEIISWTDLFFSQFSWALHWVCRLVVELPCVSVFACAGTTGVQIFGERTGQPANTLASQYGCISFLMIKRDEGPIAPPSVHFTKQHVIVCLVVICHYKLRRKKSNPLLEESHTIYQTMHYAVRAETNTEQFGKRIFAMNVFIEQMLMIQYPQQKFFCHLLHPEKHNQHQFPKKQVDLQTQISTATCYHWY